MDTLIKLPLNKIFSNLPKKLISGNDIIKISLTPNDRSIFSYETLKLVIPRITLPEGSREKFSDFVNYSKQYHNIDIVENKKNKIKNELSLVISILDFIYDKKIADNLNHKPKHLNPEKKSFTELFKDKDKNIPKRDTNGVFIIRKIMDSCDYDLCIKRLTEHNIKIPIKNSPKKKRKKNANKKNKKNKKNANKKNEDKKNDDENRFEKELCYKYLLVLIIQNLKGYNSLLENSLQKINEDNYFASDRFGYDVFPNRIIKITDKNKELVGDVYTKFENIIIIRTGILNGFIREGTEYIKSYGFILCQSKNTKMWNIFCYSENNNTIKYDIIKNYFQDLDKIIKLNKPEKNN